MQKKQEAQQEVMQKMQAKFEKQIGKLEEMHGMHVQSSSTTIPKVVGRDIPTPLTSWSRLEPISRPRFYTSKLPKLSFFSRAEHLGKDDVSFYH